MGDKEQHIRLRAYHIWEREGRGEGRAEDHWREAESEVERELAQPAVQVVELQEPTKKKANGAGKPSAAKKAPLAKPSDARADASGLDRLGKSRPQAAARRHPPTLSRPVLLSDPALPQNRPEPVRAKHPRRERAAHARE